MYELPDPCPSRPSHLAAFYSAFAMPSAGWANYKDMAFSAQGFGALGRVTSARTDIAAFVPDLGGAGGTALRVTYAAGAYGSSGGLNFQAFPIPLGEEARLTYKVYFPPDFDWVLGGKLPGLFGGTNSCTSGEWSPDCWSLRMMWRQQGKIDSYIYVPPASQSCELPGLPRTDLDCDSLTGTCAGITVARGAGALKRGVWQTIDVYARMNTRGQQDGAVALAIDGQTLLYFDKLMYRTGATPAISSVIFQTFFGGGSSRYAPKTPQTAYLKDFAAYSNPTPNPAFLPGPPTCTPQPAQGAGPGTPAAARRRLGR